MLSRTEENYLKAIFKISENENGRVNTNSIANITKTSAASVTDMIKRLAEKDLVAYEKYKGVFLSKEGNRLATNLIRRHRLWEYFLVEKLQFSWDEVHDIAEELEHVNSEVLIDRLDKYLDYPKYDPHGDPIPNSSGKFTLRAQKPLIQMAKGQIGIVIGVAEHSKDFLHHLNDINISLGSAVTVLEKNNYDNVMQIKVNDSDLHTISEKVSRKLLMKCT